ncbi:MAG: RHS repeat-associated core domain-containing protein [Chloroflexaceae bacterium]|nr:RHS repeat-associated core domain-containing protein [Chloroflexaceae bacterium]
MQATTPSGTRVLTHTYDQVGRLTGTVEQPGNTHGFAYDRVGNLLRQQVNGITTTVQTYNNAQEVVDWHYDAADNLLTLQSSNVHGTSVRYAYDELNRLQSVTDQRLNPGTTRYTYDAVGNLDTLTYPNGVASTHTYDDLNRLTTVAVGSGTLGQFTYTLDAAGMRTRLVDHTGRTIDYSYDQTYRLVSEQVTNDPQSANGSVSYTYDAAGNRLRRTSTLSGVDNQSFSYDANDRRSDAIYDPNGNLLSAGGTTSTYDYANRLVSDGSVRLVYDGDGHLVQQTVGGVTTTYLVDEQNPTGYAQIVEEAGAGTVQRTLTYGYDLLSLNDVVGGSGTAHFVGYDGLGSVRLLTDSTGAVSDRYEYEAFGTVLRQTGSTANPYQFTGERFDATLGLYYLRARWYDGGTGRFLTRDTYPIDVQNPGELNRYGYTANNPVNGDGPERGGGG